MNRRLMAIKILMNSWQVEKDEGQKKNQLVMLAHEGRITSVDLTECFEMLQMTYSKLSEISEVINHGDCDSGPG